jgi:PadR family transcriptional regulator, regulatory protein PadR
VAGAEVAQFSSLRLLSFSPLDSLEQSGNLPLVYLEEAYSMVDKSATLVQGTLDMLILKTLALEPLHGYGIAQRIEQISRGVFQVNPGSLFPAFRRLERSGLIDSQWRATENNRRAKYYVLTDDGRRKLNSETKEWGRQIAAIARILEARG